MFGDLGKTRSHWRQGRVPTPSSQTTTVDMLEGNGAGQIQEDSDADAADPDLPSDVDCEPE